MIRVSVLRGPSAIAFAHWMKETPVIDGKPLSVRIIDSPDLMQATLIKGEADIAVLPMISAVNLYNKGIRYHLAGCPIWGTLYLAGRSDKGISGENKSVLHIFVMTVPTPAAIQKAVRTASIMWIAPER